MLEENKIDKQWVLTIVNETKDGYLCMTPNGDTQWLTKKEYEEFNRNRTSRQK